MRRRKVVVVGDLLLDRDLVGRVERLAPDAPVPVVDVDTVRQGPGGAGLAALLCTGPGREVVLVAPVADDPNGAVLRDLLGRGGVHLVALDHEGGTRTKTRVRGGGLPMLRLDEGGPGTPSGALPAEAVTQIEAADVVLVSCYGAGTSTHAGLRELLTQRARARRVVWDPHPRGDDPVVGCTVVTPNLAEATSRVAAAPTAGTGETSVPPPDDLARRLLGSWQARGVCVTAGPGGAWLATPAGETLHVPTSAVDGDPCGAGDRFAASVATALAHGNTLGEAVTTAVADATAWVAAGGTGTFRTAADDPDVADSPDPASSERGAGRTHAPRSAAPVNGTAPSAEQVVAEVRSAGGTVVATGGCFDVLHAGHVQGLQAARELGDLLVVLLNSDASVRRLKGPGRPVQSAADRAQVLLGLSCVDAVVVFDEDDPRHALAHLRPDVWAKGGDYEGSRLPETDLVRSWGGRVVLLPYLPGRSTSSILQDVR